MNTILIPIRPRWCELIANGKKRIEARKRLPQVPTPYKCLIYCTKTSGEPLLIGETRGCRTIKDKRHPEEEECFDDTFGNGRVIGEFICNAEYLLMESTVWSSVGRRREALFDDYLIGSACLTREDVKRYGNGANVFGMNIKSVKLYTDPKQLESICKMNGEPVRTAPQSWIYVMDPDEEDVAT